MKTFPLTVLAYDGPILRAYLVALRHGGWRVRRAIHLLDVRHPATKRPVGRGLPRRARTRYLAWTQDMACNHWPRHIVRRAPRLVHAITTGMGEHVPAAGAWLNDMQRPLRELLAGAAVQSVTVKGWRDPRLVEALRRVVSEPVLYTGGGIVPASVLEVPELKILHVHPGLLPQVRGADGLLWSTLVQGHPGCSCFWMARGIDTGDLVHCRRYKPLRLNVPAAYRSDSKLAYRAVYSLVDPVFRADTLLSCLDRYGPEVDAWPATPQPTAAGRTYHFMHERLRRVALDRILGGTAQGTILPEQPTAMEPVPADGYAVG